MSAVWKFVALLLAILGSSPESETANVTAFIRNSSSPSFAVEGQSFTLEWTYTLDGTVGYVQFSIITSKGNELVIGKKFGPGVITVEPAYQAQFTAQATNTRAELRILAVQKSDETTFRVNIVPSGSGGPLSQLVLVIVHFPPTFTDISENQTVTEGGNVTLKCLAEGKPMPNITWARLSDKRVVNMPLTDIRRQDAGKYRCTADNGVGNPSTGDVSIVVQYPVEAIDFGENATVRQGDNKTFSCLVDGIPKPNISWYKGSEIRGTPISSGEKFEASERGCYICVASNSLGKPVIINYCLKDEEEEFSTVSAITTSAPKGPSRTVIGVVIGVAVFMVIVIGVVTWWVYKKKHGKHTNNAELQWEEVDQMNNGGS